jgi:hypothetical protein
MGIRSDVGLAIKRNAYTSLTVEQRGKIAGVIKDADATHEHDEGFLFTWRDVKWYHDTHQDLMDLYSVLESLKADDFLVVVATPEYPDSTDGDAGDWYDNPWDLRKYSTCTLEFDNP